MAQLIIPEHLKQQSKPKVLRTKLNAPISAMNRLVVPERTRDMYYKLSLNEEWCNRYMIGYIVFVSDQEYGRIQYRRAQEKLSKAGVLLD